MAAENLGGNIRSSDLSDAEEYDFWLDRLQSLCELAGVLPTVFDPAALLRVVATLERDPVS